MVTETRSVPDFRRFGEGKGLRAQGPRSRESQTKTNPSFVFYKLQ